MAHSTAGSFSFGSPSRYYAAVSPLKPTVRKANSDFAATIEELLEQFDPQMEERVDRAFRQWNHALRELLRTEMGLRLSVGHEAQGVPVRIAVGMPAPFEQAVEGVPADLWRFLLRLPAIEAAGEGLGAVIDCYMQTGPGPLALPAFQQDVIERARDFCGQLVDALRVADEKGQAESAGITFTTIFPS